MRLPLKSAIRAILYGLYILVLGVALPPAILLIFWHETPSGLLFGISLAAIALLPAAVAVSLRWRAAVWKRHVPACLLGVLTLVLTAALCLRAPPGTPVRGSRVSSLFPGRSDYRRFSVWNLLPEIDQVKVGLVAAPLVDPLIDREQARRLMESTMALYRQMERRPDYACLGSVLNYSYAELAGLEFDTGHFYQYLPPHHPGERLPVIVFLHGSVGNFKVYLWLWQQFAEERKYIIVCPSFGFGNWERRGGVAAVRRVTRRALTELPGDPERVYLAGLSNGGRGVMRVAAAHPGDYRGLVFISAIIEREIVTARPFARGWRGPILILHGTLDRRVPLAGTTDATAALSRNGQAVTTRFFASEDHFLFFSARQAVFSALDEWLASAGGDDAIGE